MATSFSGRSRREPPTMGKQLVNFITCGCESSAPFFVIYKDGCEPTRIGDRLVWVVRSNDLTHWAIRAPPSYIGNRISGVMVSVLASSVVDRGFEPRSGQTKDYKTGICCFSAKHAALRSKSKDWLARNQNNVSEWSDMSIHGLLFQWARTIKTQL
jgi:hypothetical protein